MKQKEKDIILSMGWMIENESGSNLELIKTTPAGEEFLVVVSSDDLPGSVMDAANTFIPADHIAEMREARKNGVSSIPDDAELAKDALAIRDMLFDLANALEEGAA